MPSSSTGSLSVKAVVGFLIFVELTSGFVQGFYVPLFGTLSRHWGISDADITWFISVWTLSSAVSIPVLAKLGDMFGHRRILRLAVLLVLVGVCFVAFSQNFFLVLIGRALTGPLSVWLPLEIALIHDKISGDPARKSVGLLISSLTIGAVVGTLAAGLISSLGLPVTAMLLAPVVVTGFCVFVAFFLVPESSVRSASRIDIVGFAGLALFMVLLLTALGGIQEKGFTSARCWCRCWRASRSWASGQSGSCDASTRPSTSDWSAPEPCGRCTCSPSCLEPSCWGPKQ